MPWTTDTDGRRPRGLVAVAMAVLAGALCVASVPALAADLYKEVAPSVVRITVKGTGMIGTGGEYGVTNVGTGFFIGRDGYVVTAHHLLGRSKQYGEIVWKEDKDGRKVRTITIETRDQFGNLVSYPPGGRPANAEVRKELPTDDLALLKVFGTDLPGAKCITVRVADSTRLFGLGIRADQQVYDPLSGQTAPAPPGVGDRYRLIGFGAVEGHSGGPIFDGRVRVLAVISSGYDPAVQSVGTFPESYATPLDVLQPYLPTSIDCQTSWGIWDFFKVFLRADVRSVDRRNRSESFEERNDHCQSPVPLERDFWAAEGWKIDPASIRAEASSVSSNSVFRGVVSSSERSFRISGTVRNAGACGPPVAGVRIGLDARGSLVGSVKWTEYQEHSQPFRATSEVGPDKDEVVLPLPEGAENPVVEVQAKDGRIYKFDGSGKVDGLEVSIDRAANRVIVRPEA